MVCVSNAAISEARQHFSECESGFTLCKMHVYIFIYLFIYLFFCFVLFLRVEEVSGHRIYRKPLLQLYDSLLYNNFP